VPEAALSVPIDGLHLTGKTLADELAASPAPLTMIAFLRHYGCMFGREMVRDIRWAANADPDYPSPLFVGLGDLEETAHFMKPTWPEARIICDPDRVLFNAFGVGRGTVMQVFGPSVWACTVRASFKGNFFGRFVGDPWIMPGLFVVDQANLVRFHHEFRHQGDHPEWAKIPSLVGPGPARLPMRAGALV
jgi:hypothetical protein